MFKTRVILCNTLKKEGVPSEILENIFLQCEINLANFSSIIQLIAD